MKNRILILSGDPNSINSELILKSWKKLYKPLKNIDEITSSKKLNVIDLKLKFKNPFKVSKLSASKFINNSLNYAHDLAIKNKVKAIICLGKDNTKPIEFFSNYCDLIVSTNNMKDAVKSAYGFAKQDDTVLLSPACASFDLFKNFEDRGDKFKEEVRKL